jgi:hypothetical protein
MSEWRRWQYSGLTLTVPPPKCRGRRRSAVAPPSAVAAIPTEAPGAVSPLAAGPRDDAYGPASGDPSLHLGHAAAVDEHSVSDMDAIPNGRFASATGKDQHALVAVVDGVSESRNGDANIKPKATTRIGTLARSI